MSAGFRQVVFAAVAALGLVHLAPLAAEKALHQRADGLEIYYGILPAQVVGKHAPAHEEQRMHGGVPAGKDEYHLVVAIDDDQGRRVTDADVAATVAELGMAGTRRKLEPMSIAGSMSFGNYFLLRANRAYRITVEVRRPQHPPVIAEFDYRMR